MDVFKVKYIPKLSDELVEFIKDNVDPSMINEDGSMCQYETGLIADAFDTEMNDEWQQEMDDNVMEDIDYIEI